MRVWCVGGMCSESRCGIEREQTNESDHWRTIPWSPSWLSQCSSDQDEPPHWRTHLHTLLAGTYLYCGSAASSVCVLLACGPTQYLAARGQ
jgi:hypothetical protein